MACPVGRTPVRLGPADFTVWIDNPYYPLRREAAACTERPLLTERSSESSNR
jgi:hypothetical protein